MSGGGPASPYYHGSTPGPPSRRVVTKLFESPSQPTPHSVGAGGARGFHPRGIGDHAAAGSAAGRSSSAPSWRAGGMGNSLASDGRVGWGVESPLQAPMFRRQAEVFEEAANVAERALRHHSANLRQLSRATMLFTEDAPPGGGARRPAVQLGEPPEVARAVPHGAEATLMQTPLLPSPDRASVDTEGTTGGTLELATKVQVERIKAEMTAFAQKSIRELQLEVRQLRDALEEEVSARCDSVERVRSAADGVASELKDLRNALRQRGALHRGPAAGVMPSATVSRALTPPRGAMGANDRWSDELGVVGAAGADSFAEWVAEVWSNKDGTLFDELCANFKAWVDGEPRPVERGFLAVLCREVGDDAQGAFHGAAMHCDPMTSEGDLIAMTMQLYAQADVDVDRMLNFPGCPATSSHAPGELEEEYVAYRRRVAGRRGHNLQPCSVAGAAARECAEALARGEQAPPEAERTFRDWVKWFCALGAKRQRFPTPRKVCRATGPLQAAVAAALKARQPGDTLFWAAPTSTTSNSDMVQHWLRTTGVPNERAVFVIRGVREGVDMCRCCKRPEDLDFILPPFSCIRVARVTHDDGSPILLDCEYLRTAFPSDLERLCEQDFRRAAASLGLARQLLVDALPPDRRLQVERVLDETAEGLVAHVAACHGQGMSVRGALTLAPSSRALLVDETGAMLRELLGALASDSYARWRRAAGAFAQEGLGEHAQRFHFERLRSQLETWLYRQDDPELLTGLCQSIASTIEHRASCRAVSARTGPAPEAHDALHPVVLQDLQRQQARLEAFEQEVRCRFGADERRWDGLLTLFGESRARVTGTDMPAAGA